MEGSLDQLVRDLSELSTKDYVAVLQRVRAVQQDLEPQASQTVPSHDPLSDLPPTFLSFQLQDSQEAEVQHADLQAQFSPPPPPLGQHPVQRANPPLVVDQAVQVGFQDEPGPVRAFLGAFMLEEFPLWWTAPVLLLGVMPGYAAC